MNYDYSSENTRLEIPNPYRLQNWLLFGCAAVLVAAGLWCLLMTRQGLSAEPIVVGLALLAAGVMSAATAAKRLRFFFGRGRPRSLAPELDPAAEGSSRPADQLKELLRQGALAYPEPSGAIAGVLYHWKPQLITAPVILQNEAKTQFFNLAALLATAISFTIAWYGFGTELTRPWLGIGYGLFGAFFLLRPVAKASSAPLSMWSLVLLIAAAVLAPTVIGAVAPTMPPLHDWSIAPQTTVMLIASLIGVSLLLAAVMSQVQPPPATQTSAEQERLSINAPPSMLLDELERRLQEQWVERIPNRRYARSTPNIDPKRHAGSFDGELMEETQPLPMQGVTPSTLRDAFASKRHKWILLLDLYATALTVVAVICALVFTYKADLMHEFSSVVTSTMSAAIILMVVAAFCFKASARLWGRFDFESVLTWIEFSGTYQSANVGTGNMMNSKLQTSKKVVRTEAMTLRVWRARIESVVFGKDGARQIAALFSTDQEAKELMRHLCEFGRARSTLVAPESQADLETLKTLGAAEAVLGGKDVPLQLEQGSSAAGLLNQSPSKARFCHACGSSVLAQARFCSNCGTPLNAAPQETTA